MHCILTYYIFICIEFHQQLDAAVAVLELVPRVVYDGVRDDQVKVFDEERKTRTAAHELKMKELIATKVRPSISLSLSLSPPPPPPPHTHTHTHTQTCTHTHTLTFTHSLHDLLNINYHQESHEKSLRPALGHPSQREQLEDLNSKEEERHSCSLRLSQDHTFASKVSFLKCSYS